MNLIRLQLFDRQFYFDQGFKYQKWPVSFRINQYTIELTTQSLSCPKTLITQTSTISLEIIDQRLNEFVRLHHLDLVRQINYHIRKLRDSIREKQPVQELSSYLSFRRYNSERS